LDRYSAHWGIICTVPIPDHDYTISGRLNIHTVLFALNSELLGLGFVGAVLSASASSGKIKEMAEVERDSIT
jgi:hypothetical protein